jgi:ATP-binding cassette subfamily B protein
MNTFRRIAPQLKRYWKEILLSTAALTLGGGADLLIPRQIQRIIDVGLASGDTSVVLTSALVMIGLALLSMALTFVNTVYAVRVSENFAADVREAA